MGDEQIGVLGKVETLALRELPENVVFSLLRERQGILFGGPDSAVAEDQTQIAEELVEEGVPAEADVVVQHGQVHRLCDLLLVVARVDGQLDVCGLGEHGVLLNAHEEDRLQRRLHVLVDAEHREFQDLRRDVRFEWKLSIRFFISTKLINYRIMFWFYYFFFKCFCR